MSRFLCSPSLVSAKITVSSAYKSTQIYRNIVKLFKHFSLIHSSGIPSRDFIISSRSFRKIPYKKGERFSPCLTPVRHGKKIWSLIMISNTGFYILVHIKNYIKAFTFNFCQSPALQTLSNAFFKSINEQ